MIAVLESAAAGFGNFRVQLCHEVWADEEYYSIRMVAADRTDREASRHESFPPAVAEWRERTGSTDLIHAEETRRDALGHTVTTAWFDPPRPLQSDVESTTVVQGQEREVGRLAAGTLVRRLEANSLGAFGWLEVSTDGGASWWSNERASSAADVRRALGL